jgi:rhamnose utilization protein RhaD (predicted bifunctional aldolase and dehydrogenase)/NAD(P)-dependent dehydrogenase (short-subunit alcohol dehydrogenase family)
MENRWNRTDAEAFDGPLGSCVYASRLLGSEPSLVLHGGGNTSVKLIDHDLHGEQMEVLWVKASGHDLATIEPAMFVALRLDRIRRLVALDQLSDAAMANELRVARIDASAPTPSVEAILHAIVPATAVHHTHPDALLAIANTPDGREKIEELYGARVVVVPYARSGFLLAKATADAIGRLSMADTVGIVLMNHGLFTFGGSSDEAYSRMIDLVTEAERHLERSSAAAAGKRAKSPSVGPIRGVGAAALAKLRSEISTVAGAPVIMSRHTDATSWAFSQHQDLENLAARGPATPDHVIWTKTVPMFGRDVEQYAARYRSYYEQHKPRAPTSSMLDPAPRVIFDRELGMLTAGPDVGGADRARDIYLQTIWIIEQATALGGYTTLSPEDFFDVEYWELEQAKLDRASVARNFTGEVAIVTGAASGIGRACAVELLEHGAAVVGLDLSAAVATVSDAPAYLGVACDLTIPGAVVAAIDAGVERFGGVDMLVAAAGVFPDSAPIAVANPDAWRRAMSVNVEAFVHLLSVVHPLLVLAPRGGRVVVIGSKNVAAPGPGAGAYSASKAAANQLTRVAALEWAGDGIRVNSVHPDAVFDTALWTDELVAERAARYGLTIDEYKRRNLMGIEITSSDVAGVVAAALGPVFSCVTGAHIPIDGGNDRVI